jgi:hypothetical protein
MKDREKKKKKKKKEKREREEEKEFDLSRRQIENDQAAFSPLPWKQFRVRIVYLF